MMVYLHLTRCSAVSLMFRQLPAQRPFNYGTQRWSKSKGQTDHYTENKKGPPTSSEGLRVEHIRTQLRWTPALARERARWAPVRHDRACARHRRGQTRT